MGTRVKEMIKVKDIVEKYGEYEINEEELKKILVEPKPKTVWDLKLGDSYFYIDNDGRVRTGRWDNMDVDQRRRYYGNCFLTQEEAEFELGRRKVEAELIRLGGTRDMMSLGDACTGKYFMSCDQCDKKISIGSLHFTNNSGHIFFKTEKDCQAAIDMIGEDVIKKFFFHVK